VFGGLPACRQAGLENIISDRKLMEHCSMRLDTLFFNRLRYCIWHDWKKPERKRKNLIGLGIKQGQAYAWSRTRMGGWAVAQSPILRTTITENRLSKRGYQSMLAYYLSVKF